jgi:hypothetical protein
MEASAVVEDQRAVDPIAYIRAVGLRPEDCYGFLPLDVNEAASFLYLYRDRPEYAQARAGLPEATFVKDIDLGVVQFGVGQGRQVDVDMPAEAPGGRLGEAIAQAQAMQAAYGGMIPGGPQDPEAARIQQLDQLKAAGVLDQESYDAALYGIQGGHAGPKPGGVPVAPAAPDAPPVAIHRLYPRLYKRSLRQQFDDFIPPYRDLLGLRSEDVYGVFPRHTVHSSSGSGNSITAWEDYWLVYRDRPEYAQGRDAWEAQMNEKGGFFEGIIASMKQGSWPAAEIVPGVAGPSDAAFERGSKVEVKKDGWPRRALVLREKGSELGDELREKIGRYGYEPEQSFGLCPDFNSNSIFFAWRKN